MTGKTAPMRRKRKPQRSNTLKDIGRLLGLADTAYSERKDRLLANAASLSDANGAARSNYFRIQLAFFLRDFGVHLVANDRVFHFREDRPGAIGAAWLDDGEAGRVLRHLPVPLAGRGSAGSAWPAGRYSMEERPPWRSVPAREKARHRNEGKGQRGHRRSEGGGPVILGHLRRAGAIARQSPRADIRAMG
jgi:hypothetical protein